MKKYFERNRRWIQPAIVGIMVGTAPILLQAGGGAGATPIPEWVPSVVLAAAGFGAGLGAMFTDTTSAYFVRFVGTAAGFAVILYSIFR